MRKLYLRIYCAMLATLAALALASGVLWRQFGDGLLPFDVLAMAETLAENVLPSAAAPASEQQAALERLSVNLRSDVVLFAPDRTRLASVGTPLPPPEPGRSRSGWMHRWGSGPAAAIHLPDGRWLVAGVPRGHRHPGLGLFFVLLALAVGVGAYPVVRRLTGRLERLQVGVESLGAGDLAARVKVE